MEFSLGINSKITNYFTVDENQNKGSQEVTNIALPLEDRSLNSLFENINPNIEQASAKKDEANVKTIKTKTEIIKWVLGNKLKELKLPDYYNKLPLKTFVIFEIQAIYNIASEDLIKHRAHTFSFSCNTLFFELQASLSKNLFCKNTKDIFNTLINKIREELNPTQEKNENTTAKILLELLKKANMNIFADRLSIVNQIITSLCQDDIALKGDETLEFYLETDSNNPQGDKNDNAFNNIFQLIQDTFDSFKSNIRRISDELFTESEAFFKTMTPKKVLKKSVIEIDPKRNPTLNSLELIKHLISNEIINSSFENLKIAYDERNNLFNKEFDSASTNIIKIISICKGRLHKVLEIIDKNRKKSALSIDNNMHKFDSQLAQMKQLRKAIPDKSTVNLFNLNLSELNSFNSGTDILELNIQLREQIIRNEISTRQAQVIKDLCNCIEASIAFTELLEVFTKMLSGNIKISEGTIKLAQLEGRYEGETIIQSRKKKQKKVQVSNISLKKQKKITKKENNQNPKVEEDFSDLSISDEEEEQKIDKNEENKPKDHEFITGRTYKIVQKILSPFHKKEMPLENAHRHFNKISSYKDACFHFTHLSSLVDLMQLVRSNTKSSNLENPIIRASIRSSAIMSEQFLTAKLLEEKLQQHISHYQMNMIEQLSPEASCKKFLQKVNYGSVYSRYPHQTIQIFESENAEVPEGLKCLLKPDSEDVNSFNSFIEESLEFFKEYTSHAIQVNLEDKKKQIPLHNPPAVKELKKVLQSLSVKAEQIRAKYENKFSPNILSTDKNKEQIGGICKDILYHLTALSDFLTVMHTFPQTQFLAAIGQEILTHLQYLDELVQEYKYYEEQNEELYEHDLESLRTFRGCMERGTLLNTVQAFNTIYGAQYPHKRYSSIKSLNKNLEANEAKAEVPDTLTWRFKAQMVSYHGNEIDWEMTNSANGEKISKYRVMRKILIDQLTDWTANILIIAERELN